jgi:hypothetical protein
MLRVVSRLWAGFCGSFNEPTIPREQPVAHDLIAYELPQPTIPQKDAEFKSRRQSCRPTSVTVKPKDLPDPPWQPLIVRGTNRRVWQAVSIYSGSSCPYVCRARIGGSIRASENARNPHAAKSLTFPGRKALPNQFFFF